MLLLHRHLLNLSKTKFAYVSVAENGDQFTQEWDEGLPVVGDSGKLALLVQKYLLYWDKRTKTDT